MIGSGSYFLSGAATEELEDDPAEEPEGGPADETGGFAEQLAGVAVDDPALVLHFFCCRFRF